MNLIKRLFKALVILVILAVFALAIWQNRAWLYEHGQPAWEKLQAWASKGTWNHGRPTEPASTTATASHTGEPASQGNPEPAEKPAAAVPPNRPEKQDNGLPEPKQQAPISMETATVTTTVHNEGVDKPPLAPDEPENEPATGLATNTPAPVAASTGAAPPETDNLANLPQGAAEDETSAQQKTTRLIARVRQQVWEGQLDEARKQLQQAVEQEPENPVYLWELMQLEQYSQHFHQAARLQWRLQLLAMKAQQEQQLQQLKAWRNQMGQAQAHLNSRIQQLEKELESTRKALSKPLEEQP